MWEAKKKKKKRRGRVEIDRTNRITRKTVFDVAWCTDEFMGGQEARLTSEQTY